MVISDPGSTFIKFQKAALVAVISHLAKKLSPSKFAFLDSYIMYPFNDPQS